MRIDMHVHARQPGFPPDLLRQEYRSLQVEKGVCQSADFTLINGKPATLTAYPDTVGWLFCSPADLIDRGASREEILEYMHFCVEQGAAGFGEMTAHIYIDEDRMLPIYEYMAKTGLPMTIHLASRGESYGLIDDLGLPHLEEVLKTLPNLKILGHAIAFWAEISGDVTEESRTRRSETPVREGGRVVELMRRYPNLLADLSAGSGTIAMTRDPAFACRFLTEFADRTFYASDMTGADYSLLPPRNLAAFLEKCLASGSISQTTYDKVCRENALRLLGV